MKLTEKQRRIVEIEKHTENPYIACLASAGSGKSTVIENRVAHLVIDQKVDPRRIALFSFSRAATKEIRSRLKEKVGTQLFRELTISTLHSFCYYVVRDHYSKRTRTEINIFDQKQLFKTARTFIEKASPDAYAGVNPELFVDEYVSSRKGNRRFSLDGEYYTLYQEIRDWMESRNFFLYDDLLYHAYRIFKAQPDVLENYRNRFDYWFVDEAQDTARIMIDLIEMLIRKDSRLLLSFDIVQSLYQFAGADPFYLMNFLDRIEADLLPLDETFRFGPTIASLADSVVSNIDLDERYKMFTETSQTSNKPMYIPMPLDGVGDLCDDIEQKVLSGVAPKDISILSRTNKPLVEYQKALAKRGIPSKMKSGYFWNRTEIKLLLTVVRLFMDVQFDDLQYVTKTLAPSFEIDKQRLRLMFGACEENKVTDFLRYFLHNKVKGLGIAATGGIRKLLSYLEAVEAILFAEDRDENNMLFADVAKAIDIDDCEFMRDNENEEGVSNREERWQFIDILDTMRNEKENNPFEIETMLKIEFTTESENEADAVQLKTIHGSKGETLPHVYLVASTFNENFMNTADDLRSELFVLYVALTRTKTELQIWGRLPRQFHFLHNEDMEVFIDDEEELEEPDDGGPKTLLEELYARPVIRENQVRQAVPVNVISATAETAKAVRMKILTSDQREIDQWIPKSQMTIINEKIALAQWLATKNKLN